MQRLETLLLDWQNSIIDYLPKLFIALLVFILFFIVAKASKKWSLRFYLRIFKKQVYIAKLISFAIYVFFLMSGIFLMLEILGLDSMLSKVLAGAGIMGVVAGFAFKDIVSNLFAGLLLHIQRPFKVGDWVEIEDNFGTIKSISWLTTSIKNVSGQEVFVPNQLIYNNVFTNFSSFNKRRVIFKSGVAYGDDLELVRKVTLEEIKQVEAALKKEPIDFYFTSIGSSAYNFEVRFWIRFQAQTDYLKAMNDTIIRIKKRFEKEDISLAYSVMTLDFGVKGGVNLHDKPIQLSNNN